MAHSFGVSVAFLDKELSRFISAGRINAKIDAILGVIETTRADVQTANYTSVIKQGDALLNKMQRLARVISL
jgi:26S proteasome regulatory subunit N7